MASPHERLRRARLLSWEAGAIFLAATAAGGYAGWIAADFAPRWLTVPVIAVITGWFLLGQTGRQRLSFAYYAAAVLLLATPVLLVLPDVLASPALGVSAASMVLLEVNALLVLVFLIPGIALGYLGYRIDRDERRP